MKISSIIKRRLSENDIQKHFFSRSAIEILRMISDDMAQNPSRLRDTIMGFPHDEMLRSKKIRHLLLNALYESEAIKLLQALGTNIPKHGNPYDILNEMRFSKNGEKEKTLFAFFEEDIPSAGGRSSTESNKGATEIIDVKREMFPHQRRAINEIKKFLASGERRCLLHMPTGSGKTTTAMRVVASSFLNTSHMTVVWLAYNEDLCEQAIEEFKNTWAHAGDRSIKLFRYFGAHSPDILKDTGQDKEGIIVASLSKFNQADQRQSVFLSTLSDRTDMVIMDEAHQAIAPTYMNILQQLVEKRPGTTQLLGLSATPGRTSSDPTDSRKLAGFFDHKKVTLRVASYANPVQYLIDNGYLASPHQVLDPVDGDLSSNDLERIAKSPIDIPDDILVKLGRNVKRTLKVIVATQNLIESGHKRIMVFGTSIENSRDIYMILAALGHKSFHVDSSTSPETRSKYILEYRSDTDDVIIMCNFGVFTTGFDAPRTSAVVIARPTKSLILYSQMAGRAMRGTIVGGNKKCEIRTITDIRLPQFTKLVEGFFSWDEIW